MSRPRPPSPNSAADVSPYTTAMTEIQRRLPPPNFLNSPNRLHTDFRPSLPSLHAFPSQHFLDSAPQYRRPPQSQYPPPDTTNSSGARRTSGQAIPISALLSDDPPEPKYQRIDSLVTSHPNSHGPHPHPVPTSQGNYPPTTNAPPQYQPYGYPVEIKQERPQTTWSQPSLPQRQRGPSSSCSPTDTESRHVSSVVHSPTLDPYGGYAFAAPTAPSEKSLEYTLKMRQQPIAARACGFGERDRRVVDPPPIVELVATDKETGDKVFVSDSYTTMHCVLINDKTDEDESQIPPPAPNMASAQRLMGNVVASPCQANDEHGEEGVFFVFPDLSCRSPGKYRLLFRLLKINPLNMMAHHEIKCMTRSDPFEVFTAKEFPGMRASSALLRRLRTQGLNVGVKKGSEASKRSNRRIPHADDSDGDMVDGEDEEDEPPRMEEPGPSRPKGKAKRIRSK